MQLYLVVALLFALVVALFAVQNTIVVKIAFLIWQFEVSLVLVILGAASIGALCVFLVGMFKNINSWRKHKELEGKNKILSEKVNELEGRLSQIAQKETQTNTDQESKNEEEAVQATNAV